MEFLPHGDAVVFGPAWHTNVSYVVEHDHVVIHGDSRNLFKGFSREGKMLRIMWDLDPQPPFFKRGTSSNKELKSDALGRAP